MTVAHVSARRRWGSDVPPADAYAAQAKGLAAELALRIQGEVRFSDGDRALYATDLSMYRQVPIGAVVPRTVEDVIETVAACRRRGIPVLPRDCGTGLAGQTCNIAVVIDCSKYLNKILEIDPVGRTAWVEPGVICDQLREAVKPHGLTWAPDPATHEYCTFGGMIGNNSCGAHSVMGGKTVDNIEELEILTYEGHRFCVGATDDAELAQIIDGGGPRGQMYRELRELRDHYADEVRRRYPDIPRRVSGYNLDELLPENGFHVARALVGSEGTCVMVLRAKIRLIPNPPNRALLVLGYSDPGTAGDHVPALLATGPVALEAVTRHVPDNEDRKGRPMPGARLLPDGDTWLLVEFGGESQDEATQHAQDAVRSLEQSGDGNLGNKIFDDPDDQTAVWEVREAGVGASRVPGIEDAWPSWEDSAVPPERVGDYLRDFIALLHRYDYAYSLYGHFGQGCIHSRITFDTKTVDGVATFRSFMEEASDLVVAYGGSLSATRNIPRVGGHTCSSRCCAASRSPMGGRATPCGNRSTSASPAKDARATVRRAWTLPRIALNSSRTIGRDESGRGQRMPSGSSTNGRVWPSGRRPSPISSRKRRGSIASPNGSPGLRLSEGFRRTRRKTFVTGG